MKRPTPVTRLLGVLAGVSLFVAACGDDDSDVTPDAGVDEDQVEVEEDLGEDEAGLGEEEEMEQESQGVMEDVAFQTELDSLNGSDVSGTATIEATSDGMVTVSLETTGFVGGNPHAAHLHIGGNNECPGEDVAGEDGLISTAEGIPAYGEVQVSLTTEGDVGADSALAVERFPVAAEDGSVTYERTFELPSGVTAEDLSNAVVVQHGFASLGGDEMAFDGEAQSSLDPSLPLEATIPVACGPLEEQPEA
jgi:hypothetical protein